MDTYIQQGYSFFNTGTNEKKCVTKWQEYTQRKPTTEEIEFFRSMPTQNYAIVCGEISDLIVIDVDTKNGADVTPFLNRGMREIRTPSGGYHFYVKYEPSLANTKHKRVEAKLLHGVDIQSNRSIVFAPPTKFVNGEYTVTNDVPVTHMPDDLLLAILDEIEEKQPTVDVFFPQIPANSKRPGDIFNALATWDDVLLPLGWVKKGRVRNDGSQLWYRPNKDKDSTHSASTNHRGYDLFFPYTTYYNELEQLRGYTKFSFVVHMQFGGDVYAAMPWIREQNFLLAKKYL